MLPVNTVTQPSPIHAAINRLLPIRGAGYECYGYDLRNPRHCTTLSVEQMLKDLGVQWSLRAEFQVIQVGDISRLGGVPFPPHAGHRTGNQVDFRPFRIDKQKLPTDWRERSYSKLRTFEFLELLHSKFKVKLVLFNDKDFIAKGLCQHYDGHDNHLHVKFPAF